MKTEITSALIHEDAFLKQKLNALEDLIAAGTLRRHTKVYGYILDLLAGRIVQPNYYLGRGRFVSLQRHNDRFMDMLFLLDIPFIKTNEAPRGGAIGITFTPAFGQHTAPNYKQQL